MIKLKYVIPDLYLPNDVAVVGSSSNILSKEYGCVIDSFKEVIRFNRAEVKGYEKDVGSKTTLLGANIHLIRNKKKDWANNNISLLDFFNIKIISLDQNNLNLKEVKKSINQDCIAFAVDYKKIIEEKILKGNSKPTVGFTFIILCVLSGIFPHVFGFGVNEGDKVSHYFEKRPNKSTHSIEEEREILNKWSKENKIKLYL